MAELTPMMKQYVETKKQYPDTILMFRLGDFYEMFFEDAVTASRELELVLTGRDCGQEERAPMCGVPFHSVDPYIAKLVSRGYKVAVCEQMEDPALAKGIVKREVTRILTPGTVIESAMLDESKNNYLASVFARKDAVAVCFADVSTGHVHLTEFSGRNNQKKVINELGRFAPSEVLLNEAGAKLAEVASFVSGRINAIVEVLDSDYYDENENTAFVLKHFGKVSLDELGLGESSAALAALASAMRYLRFVEKTELENITDIDVYTNANFMHLDVSTLRNLEIVETMRNREKKGSLLWVLDKTKTSMGKRMLRSWLEQPLMSLPRITRRHAAVEELLDNAALRDDLSTELSGCQDMERLMTRILYGTANARELRALCATAQHLPVIKSAVSGCKSSLLCEIERDIDTLDSTASLIDTAIVEEPPFSVREGGIINQGFNEELDSLRNIVDNGKGFIADIQLREQEKTGIKKLKIGYNRVFGYYIEVSNSFKELVPETYIRKQTLANCERYITQELKELESKVLGAQERIVKLEYEIFESIRKRVADKLSVVQRTAHAVASLDVICSFAQCAAQNNYIRPDMTEQSVISITDGRHPVVEKMLDGAPFVPNDTRLDCAGNRCAIITGPNMAGKSTYMRQVALICLMAQAGSFVPASAATLGIADGIYTRIGASDDLSAGQSTFMVEMSEVATILKNATSKSLIVFDEIGRGTSTFDGMSIARAVLEFAADKSKLGAKTLFATHYHELTELESSVEGVKNYNIAVKKRGDDITFLRRIVSGAADGSYGIEVAKLAGVPNHVVERAKVILADLEGKDSAAFSDARNVMAQSAGSMQLSFASSESDAIIQKLKEIDVNTLTPIEAMSLLYQLSADAGAIN
ncbi:MAG: DNA mismatch repair protein MutS [Clostridia bacterium]|nr:DNA mismatch repair protein MutS [Clostridia bacterium]